MDNSKENKVVYFKANTTSQVQELKVAIILLFLLQVDFSKAK